MNYEQHKIPPAEQRYPDLFAFLDSAIGYLSDVIDVGGLPIPSTHLAFVRFAAVIRAFNLLKSIRQLLATDHWENAAVLMRSLFELVLNVEEIGRDPETAEAQAERFVRFETLQRCRRLIAESDYELQTGRRTEHDPKLIAIQQALPRFFSEWARTRKDGTTKWSNLWCGKNVRQLCEASGSRERIGQYDIVYAYGSDMAHSSPIGVLSTFQRTNAVDLDSCFAQTDESERRETLEVLSLSVAFAFEVVGHSKFVDDAFDPIRMMEISRALYGLHGVKAPPLDPAIEAAMRAKSEDPVNGTGASGTAGSAARSDKGTTENSP